MAKSAKEPQYWERRGAAIYEEDDGTPGKAKCIAELHPAEPAIVQQIVDAHNAAVSHG